jgi:hypothetical protein
MPNVGLLGPQGAPNRCFERHISTALRGPPLGLSGIGMSPQLEKSTPSILFFYCRRSSSRGVFFFCRRLSSQNKFSVFAPALLPRSVASRPLWPPPTPTPASFPVCPPTSFPSRQPNAYLPSPPHLIDPQERKKMVGSLLAKARALKHLAQGSSKNVGRPGKGASTGTSTSSGASLSIDIVEHIEYEPHRSSVALMPWMLLSSHQQWKRGILSLSEIQKWEHMLLSLGRMISG